MFQKISSSIPTRMMLAASEESVAVWCLAIKNKLAEMTFSQSYILQIPAHFPIQRHEHDAHREGIKCIDFSHGRQVIHQNLCDDFYDGGVRKKLRSPLFHVPYTHQRNETQRHNHSVNDRIPNRHIPDRWSRNGDDLP